MNTICNLHTHCTYCHGLSSMEDMVIAAIDAGLKILGISCHNFAGLDFISYQMKEENVDSYFAEIERLQKKYGDRIAIFKGLEIESRNGKGEIAQKDPRCDYSIGSIHYFNINGQYHSVDSEPELFTGALEAAGNDISRLWRIYFDEVKTYATQSDYDITGHIDLISKFNEKCHLFDESDPLYQSLAIEALDTAIDCGKIIEINNGAICSGWKTTSYPAPFLIRRIRERNARIIISSDTHHTSTIVQSFDQTEKMLRDFGFSEQMILTKNGFEPIAL